MPIAEFVSRTTCPRTLSFRRVGDDQVFLLAIIFNAGEPLLRRINETLEDYRSQCDTRNALSRCDRVCADHDDLHKIGKVVKYQVTNNSYAYSNLSNKIDEFWGDLIPCFKEHGTCCLNRAPTDPPAWDGPSEIPAGGRVRFAPHKVHAIDQSLPTEVHGSWTPFQVFLHAFQDIRKELETLQDGINSDLTKWEAPQLPAWEDCQFSETGK
jgi:hypothetical protein